MNKNILFVALIGLIPSNAAFGLSCSRGTVVQISNKSDDIYTIRTSAYPSPKMAKQLLPKQIMDNRDFSVGTHADHYLTLQETGSIILESPTALKGAGIKITIVCQESTLSAVATVMQDYTDKDIKFIKDEPIGLAEIDLKQVFAEVNKKIAPKKRLSSNRWHTAFIIRPGLKDFGFEYIKLDPTEADNRIITVTRQELVALEEV